MPVILVVIIAGAWIVILGPNLMKRRSRASDGINSISHFHRALRTLEHSAPEPIVAPAYRLRSVGGAHGPGRSSGFPEVSAVPVLTVVGADQLPRPALAFLGEAPSRTGNRDVAADDARLPVRAPLEVDTMADSSLAPVPSGRRGELYPRNRVLRRRRNTLGVLAMVFLATIMIGFVPGLGAAWVLSTITGVVLAAYVGLLVQLRRSAEERERKLHYLDPIATSDDPALGMPRVPVYMSGRYAHPSNQAVAAH